MFIRHNGTYFTLRFVPGKGVFLVAIPVMTGRTNIPRVKRRS